jgi:hypothetical protein
MKLAKINLILGAILCSLSLSASDKSQLKFNSSKLPEISLNNEVVISCPQEGLWAVASEWENDWPSGWKYANPDSLVTSGEWTVAYGSIDFPNGRLLLRDSWRTQKDGLIQCVRRYEWTGNETLEKVVLSARLRMKGEEMMPLMPGILYYGNKMGQQINPNIIPVYNGKAGDFVMLGGSKIAEVECVGKFPIKDRTGDFEKPVGEWNTVEVVCQGNSITVYINGQLQNQATSETSEGYIALQSEGGPIEFRNVYLE